MVATVKTIETGIDSLEDQIMKNTILPVCLNYIRQRITQSSPDQHAAIFRAACYILAPHLKQADAQALCTAVGLSRSYIHTYHAALKQTRLANASAGR